MHMRNLAAPERQGVGQIFQKPTYAYIFAQSQQDSPEKALVLASILSHSPGKDDQDSKVAAL